MPNLKKHKIMSKTKTQLGTSLTADLHENTWTFEMPTGFSVAAGKYIIMPKENYNTALSKIALLNSFLENDKAKTILQELLEEISHSGV